MTKKNWCSCFSKSGQHGFLITLHQKKALRLTCRRKVEVFGPCAAMKASQLSFKKDQFLSPRLLIQAMMISRPAVIAQNAWFLLNSSLVERALKATRHWRTPWISSGPIEHHWGVSNAQWNYIVQRNVSLIPGRNIIDSFVHPKTNTPPNFTRFVQSSKNLQLKVPEKLRDGGMTISVQSSWQNFGLPSSVMQILKWRASKKLSVMC